MNPEIRLAALKHAMAVFGEHQSIAKLLGVRPPSVAAMLAGEEEIPLDVFLRTVDILDETMLALRRLRSDRAAGAADRGGR